jgi:hypothetical protein
MQPTSVDAFNGDANEIAVTILSMPGAANYAEDKEAVEIEHHKFVRIGLGTMHRGVESAAGRGRVIPHDTFAETKS